MCPACKEPMVVFELDGIEIDRCLRCAGTWLDAGEIDQLARLGGGTPDRLTAAIAKADGGRKGERHCVRCSARMRVVSINGVDVDRCPRGHGLWFDKSEMESVIASFHEGAMARFLGELDPSRAKKGG